MYDLVLSGLFPSAFLAAVLYFISKLACVFDMLNLSHSPSFYLHTKQHLNFIRFAHCSVKLCTSPLTICCLYPISAVSKISRH